MLSTTLVAGVIASIAAVASIAAMVCTIVRLAGWRRQVSTCGEIGLLAVATVKTAGRGVTFGIADAVSGKARAVAGRVSSGA